jgi:amidase
VIAKLDPEVERALEATAGTLRSLGHDVVERDPDYGHSSADVTARYLRGIHDDARRMPHPERLERRTRGMAALGRLVTGPGWRRLREREERLAARINRIFDDVDVVMTPALAWPPAEVGRWDGRGALRTLFGPSGVGAFTPFTPPWNGTGNPAAAVPAGFSAGGLPLAVQLVGRRGDEWTLLALAAQLEAETGWPERVPPLAAESAAGPAGADPAARPAGADPAARPAGADPVARPAGADPVARPAAGAGALPAGTI